MQRCGVGDQNLPLDARRALFTTDLCATAKSGASLVSERNQKSSETIRADANQPGPGPDPHPDPHPDSELPFSSFDCQPPLHLDPC